MAGSDEALAALVETLDRHDVGKPLRCLTLGAAPMILGGQRELRIAFADIVADRGAETILTEPYDWRSIRNASLDLIVIGAVLAEVEFPWIVVEQACRKLRTMGFLFLQLPAESNCPVALDVLARANGMGVFDHGADDDRWCVAVKEPRIRPPGVASRVPDDRYIHPVVRRHSRNPLAIDMDLLREPVDPLTELMSTIVELKLPEPRILELSAYSSRIMRDLKCLIPTADYRRVEVFPPEQPGLSAGRLDDILLERIDVATLVDSGLEADSFDLLIVHDALERVFDPWEMLREVVKLLRIGGTAVVYAPNLQNMNVLGGISEGAWNRLENTAMDPYCIRFFTLPDLIELCTGAGLAIANVSGKIDPPTGLETLPQTGNQFRAGRIEVKDLTKNDLTQFLLSDYIIVAQRTQ